MERASIAKENGPVIRHDGRRLYKPCANKQVQKRRRSAARRRPGSSYTGRKPLISSEHDAPLGWRKASGAGRSEQLPGVHLRRGEVHGAGAVPQSVDHPLRATRRQHWGVRSIGAHRGAPRPSLGAWHPYIGQARIPSPPPPPQLNSCCFLRHESLQHHPATTGADAATRTLRMRTRPACQWSN